jgi:hypothetical protein
MTLSEYPLLLPQVREAIDRVQAGLLAADPALEGCLLEPATAHLTILVLNLPEQVGLRVSVRDV